MKVLVKNICRIILVLLPFVVNVGCSEDNDTVTAFFELSSTELECNSSNVVNVAVPMEGQTYKLSVKSSVDVIWTVKYEGGSWLVATPVTKQSGDGEILIVASSNPTNIQNRVATVTIKNSVNDEVYQYVFAQLHNPNQLIQKEEAYTHIYYNEYRYNKDEFIYTTSVNKVEGNVAVSSLGQEDLDKYNEDNLTSYMFLPVDCYSLPESVTFGSESSAPLDITFKKKIGVLDSGKEYMLPISISVGDRKTEIIWLVVDVNKRNISRNVKTFNFYNANQDITTSLTINNGEGKVTLSPFTEEELQAHNSLFSTAYVSIPTDYIIMPTSVDFDEAELTKDVKITFKKEVGGLDEEKVYVWGVRVSVDGYPVSEIFMKPHITTPLVTMNSKDYKHVLILNEKEKKASYDFELSLDVQNQWEFTVEFEGNESELQKAVSAYNTKNSTSYALLPKANVALSSSKFMKEDNKISVIATLTGDGLNLNKNYLYPVIPTGCGSSPFDVGEKVTYLHVVLEDRVNSINDLKDITLNASMLKASGTNGSDVVGNLLAYNGYWESIWGTKVDPKIDPVYGVYIDIDFSQQVLTQAFSFNYLPRSYTNAVPNQIAIYAGTSKDDLKKIGELEFEKDQLPYKDKYWIGSVEVDKEDKSKLSLYKLKESGVTLVRVSFLSNRDASTKDGKDGPTRSMLNYNWQTATYNHPCVALQQLKVYGK